MTHIRSSGPALGSSAPWAPETPFLAEYVFAPESEARPLSPPNSSGYGYAPFFAAYLGGSDESPDGNTALLSANLLNELHDDELDEAVQELVDEAWELVGPRMSRERGYDAAREIRIERMLSEHFEPLARRAEHMTDQMAEQFSSTLEYAENEVDAVLEAFTYEIDGVSPPFNNFLKSWRKKLGKVVKKVGAVAKKASALGLKLAGGPLIKLALGRLKTVLRPFLKKIINFALDKVSPANRALLEKVVQALGGSGLANAGAAALKAAFAARADVAAAATGTANGAAPGATNSNGTAAAAGAPATDGDAGAAEGQLGDPASADIGEIQNEMDLELTEMLFGREEPLDEYSGFASYAPFVAAEDPLGELDVAREQFVREISELSPGQSPQPALENFIPAVLAAVKLGVKLIGEPRVGGVLAQMLTPLIQPVVGKAVSPALGKAIAGAGLKLLLKMELEEDEIDALGPRAVASVVEETLREVSRLPMPALRDQDELESSLRMAHEAAVARNFPPSIVRPALRETTGINATWVAMPQGGAKYYKKFTKVFDVTLSPQLADGIRTFGGRTLRTFLTDGLRVEGVRRARVHLYEAIPRTSLSRIAKLEQVRGLGSSERSAWSQFHPLTGEAAAALLQQPGLGRSGMQPDRKRVTIGDRFYFLEVEGAAARPRGEGTHVEIALDLLKAEIRLHAYLSEVATQRVAGMLRKDARPGAASSAVRALLTDVTSAFTAGRGHEFVRVVRTRSAPGGAASARPIPREVRRAMERAAGAAVIDWFWPNLMELFKTGAAEFTAQADRPADGVTLAVTFPNPPEFQSLRAVLEGAANPSKVVWTPKRPPAAKVNVLAGHVRG